MWLPAETPGNAGSRRPGAETPGGSGAAEKKGFHRPGYEGMDFREWQRQMPPMHKAYSYVEQWENR